MLDAADDAVELVDAGDDDDRHVAEGLVRLERREGLVAVHVGHDDVEQDDVDRLRSPGREDRERRPAVTGLERPWPDPAEQPGQQPAVEHRVVDDEDTSGQGVGIERLDRRGCGGRARCRGAPGGLPCGTSARAEIARLSASGRIGFERSRPSPPQDTPRGRRPSRSRSRHDAGRPVRPALAQTPGRFEAVEPRHLNVHQDHVETSARGGRCPPGRRRRRSPPG